MMMEEDRLGMRIQSETIEISKDENGLIGITIGGGHPYCPCVYVLQIFDNSSAFRDGRIRCGDEIVAVNGISVKGEKKQSVASLIQCSTNPVKITINKLEADSSKGKTMDIILKKAKHKVVEFMDNDSADALGLSRAILCNDPLLKKMKVLEDNNDLYRNLISLFTDLILYQEKMNTYQKEFGDIFCELAAHEAQLNANETFSSFGEVHRQLEKRQGDAFRSLRPMVSDLEVYVEKVVPDTRLTLKKYLDVKYEYLSYCLKLKELDDEELEYRQLDEPLYRVDTGNYEYRLMLRCRQEIRQRFVQMRNDVMVKIELLDQKHVRDIAAHLTTLATVMSSCQADCTQQLQKIIDTPIEMDLAQMSLRESHIDVGEEAFLLEENTSDTNPPEPEVADLIHMDPVTDSSFQDPVEYSNTATTSNDLNLIDIS